MRDLAEAGSRMQRSCIFSSDRWHHKKVYNHYVMKKTLVFLSLLCVGFFGLQHVAPVYAGGSASLSKDPLGVDYGQYSGLSGQDLRVSVARVIKFILGFLGLIFLILTLYAGFMWMTSAGNEDRVGTAKKILWGAIIGLAIVLFSYAITQFVVVNLYQVSTGGA